MSVGEEHNVEHERFQGHVTYAAGYITRYLEDYSTRVNLSPNDFAIRVAELIYASQGGEIRRPDDNVPSLRREGTERNQTTRKVAVVSSTHRKTPKGVGVGGHLANITRDAQIRKLGEKLTTQQLSVRFQLSPPRIRQILDSKEPAKEKRKVGPTKCKKCDKMFPTRTAYVTHRNLEHPLVTYKS